MCCTLYYRGAARVFPELARPALTYAYLEDCAAKEAHRFLMANADIVPARKRSRLYRPFEPHTVDEARVLLRLSQPEDPADLLGWHQHWVRAADWYRQVEHVSEVEHALARKRREVAEMYAERYRQRRAEGAPRVASDFPVSGDDAPTL
jgi:hypothetical protein